MVFTDHIFGLWQEPLCSYPPQQSFNVLDILPETQLYLQGTERKDSIQVFGCRLRTRPQNSTFTALTLLFDQKIWNAFSIFSVVLNTDILAKKIYKEQKILMTQSVQQISTSKLRTGELMLMPLSDLVWYHCLTPQKSHISGARGLLHIWWQKKHKKCVAVSCKISILHFHFSV